LHKKGILGEVIGKLSENGANILTITQNLPIQSVAHVVMLLDLSHVKGSAEALMDKLNAIEGVSGAHTIAIE
jgi:chorismate mutase